jgi:hypothetical protein
VRSTFLVEVCGGFCAEAAASPATSAASTVMQIDIFIFGFLENDGVQGEADVLDNTNAVETDLFRRFVSLGQGLQAIHDPKRRGGGTHAFKCDLCATDPA